MKLTERQFWDSRNTTCAPVAATEARSREGRIRRALDKARLRRGAQPGQSYASFALEKLLAKHLPVHADWSAIEVGCAPGTNLVTLRRMFGYRPYGVEYSHAGVVSTCETFCQHGFDADNVIEADFFDQGFHDRFQGNFDVVFSSGFIEHFIPPDEVIRRHISLLRTGGYLVCVIPNLRGLFYPFLWMCARDLLGLHNLRLMRKNAFRRAFEPFGLDTKFCGYVGAFQFYGASLRKERSLRGRAAAMLDRIQDGLDFLLFLCTHGGLSVSRLSGSLVFIGQRIK